MATAWLRVIDEGKLAVTVEVLACVWRNHTTLALLLYKDGNGLASAFSHHRTAALRKH